MIVSPAQYQKKKKVESRKQRKYRGKKIKVFSTRQYFLKKKKEETLLQVSAVFFLQPYQCSTKRQRENKKKST